MIEVTENHVKIEGTNLDVLTNVIQLFDSLLETQPEIINAVVAGYTTKLSKSIETCNPTILKLLVHIVETYNERSEQS